MKKLFIPDVIVAASQKLMAAWEFYVIQFLDFTENVKKNTLLMGYVTGESTSLFKLTEGA